MPNIFAGKGNFTTSDTEKVLFQNAEVELDSETLANLYKSYYFLKEFLKDKIIYGINTGFGPMAQYHINQKDQVQLQYNLIRSHCCGSGAMLPGKAVKAMMLVRLNSLALGFSGIHPDAVVLLKEMLNREILPIIFEHGGLGASGDLVQLAHLALAMIGEGKVIHKGKIKNTAEAFDAENLIPTKVFIREGLAIMNGTACMTGIGMLNIIHAQQLLKRMVQASALLAELVGSFDDPYSQALNEVKHHTGQNEIALQIRNIINDSHLIKNREKLFYTLPEQAGKLLEKVQEQYSIRCIPQILGPILDTLNFAEKVVINELNSVSDNPVIDYERKNVFHGGNFHGDCVSLEMDKLKLAIVRLSMVSERQLNFLMNDALNLRFPPFVNLGIKGLNIGLQGAQFTATSTVAENMTLSASMYVHSIPSNNENQDIVSMGANAALLTSKVIQNAFEVLSVEFLALMQAVDHLKCQDQLSPDSRQRYKEIRNISPKIIQDAVLYPQLENICTFLKSN